MHLGEVAALAHVHDVEHSVSLFGGNTMSDCRQVRRGVPVCNRCRGGVVVYLWHHHGGIIVLGVVFMYHALKG